MTFILKFILVMISVGLADMCWTKYLIHVAAKNAMKSAVWASLIMVCGMFSLISYMEDKRLIPAAFIGGFIGTYFTVKKSKQKEVEDGSNQD